MANFTIERSTTIAASSAVVHAQINDFHQWHAWSPWEDIDPTMARSYTGPDEGVGAHYAWIGNRKAGAGNMEITESEPAKIDIRLEFLKPWKAVNQVAFTLLPIGGQTEVTWTMTGEHKGLMKVVGRFMNLDKMVGKDFEKGLARLKVAAEAGTR